MGLKVSHYCSMVWIDHTINIIYLPTTLLFYVFPKGLYI